MRIAVIVASVRPNRIGRFIGDWVLSVASGVEGAEFELVDLMDHNLPNFDSDGPPAAVPVTNPEALAFAEIVGGFDGFIIVTPEYNHTLPGSLKNAIDWVWKEWHHKSAGFVGYGVVGAARAIETLRCIAGQVYLADVSPSVNLLTSRDIDRTEGRVGDDPRLAKSVETVAREVVRWGSALKELRS